MNGSRARPRRTAATRSQTSSDTATCCMPVRMSRRQRWIAPVRNTALAPAEPRFVFDTPIDEVWDRALKENGIDPSMLVPGGGEN